MNQNGIKVVHGWKQQFGWLKKSQWNRTFEADNCVHPHSKIGILSALKRRWYGLFLWNNCPHVPDPFKNKFVKESDAGFYHQLCGIQHQWSLYKSRLYWNWHECWLMSAELLNLMNTEHSCTYTHKCEHIHVDYTPHGLIVRDKQQWHGNLFRRGYVCSYVFYPSILFGEKINNYILSRIFRHFFINTSMTLCTWSIFIMYSCWKSNESMHSNKPYWLLRVEQVYNFVCVYRMCARVEFL